MVAACFMGIKLLCYNLVYRPWLAETNTTRERIKALDITRNYKRIKKLVENIGSILYFLLIDNFVEPVTPVDRTEKDEEYLQKEFGVRATPAIKVAPKLPSKEEETDEQEVGTRRSEDSREERRRKKKKRRAEEEEEEE